MESRMPCKRGKAMTIQIRDPELEARLQKQLEATGSNSLEELLLRLLENQEEQDRWLLENREGIKAKIQRGIDQLDRGEGIPEDKLKAYLSKLKAKPE
jgi:predicted transcriptional regulator